MKKRILILVVGLIPSVVRAGGFELVEHSAQGMGMAGAQAAVADDSAAISYNPALIAFQRGLGVIAGVNLIHPDDDVTPQGSTTVRSSATEVAPTVFVTQRLGPHFAVGIGMFTQFAQHLEYPNNWVGRFQGTYLDLKTVNINPTVAIRPIPRLSIGFGLDILPGWIGLNKALNFGGSEGTAQIAGNAVGVGGNVGVAAVLVPRWLTLGVTYRSRIDLDITGRGAIFAPPELASMASGVRNASTTVVIPHNFTFALGTHPLPDLKFDVDVHLTLWHDLSTITVTLTDPKAAPGAMPTKDSVVLNWRDSVGVRVGGEWTLVHGHLPIRLGVGYDVSPAPSATLGPFSPDSNRLIVGAGIGWHQGVFGAELGYAAAILFTRTSTNPDFPATYFTLGHGLAINLTLRMEDLFRRIDVPAYKN